MFSPGLGSGTAVSRRRLRLGGVGITILSARPLWSSPVARVEKAPQPVPTVPVKEAGEDPIEGVAGPLLALEHLTDERPHGEQGIRVA